jgi:starvation-inducible DNA-binding protein
MASRKNHKAEKSTELASPNLLKAEIGLDDKARSYSIDTLNRVLANTYMLYTKTRKYHWNVTGIHFGVLHALFETQYDQLEEAMDEVAERVRQVGGLAIGTLTEMKQCSTLDEQPGHNPSANDMIGSLLADHEQVIRELREAVDKTDDLGDMGTSDFLTGLMEAHEKMAWMLRAHLEGDGGEE